SSTTSPTRQAAGRACVTPARSVAMTTASNSTPDGKSTSSPMARSGGPPRPGVSTPPSPRGTPPERDAPLAARTPHVPLGELAEPARGVEPHHEAVVEDLLHRP